MSILKRLGITILSILGLSIAGYLIYLICKFIEKYQNIIMPIIAIILILGLLFTAICIVICIICLIIWIITGKNFVPKFLRLGS